MFINVKLKVWFDLQENVQVIFKDYIEVSLDCYKCKALHRTVIISSNLTSISDKSFGYIPNRNVDELKPIVNSKEVAFCTPKNHLFPGYIKNTVSVMKKNRIIGIEYIMEYSYEEFTDKKYNKQSTILPSWARVSFDVICPNCKNIKNASTQNNMVRPFKNGCNCGFEFYTEQEKLPIIEIM